MAKTSQEDIDRQHQEAVHMLAASAGPSLSECVDLVMDDTEASAYPKNEIPLSSKKRPVCDVLAEGQNDESETGSFLPPSPPSHQSLAPYWTTRGYCNIENLQKLVQRGYNRPAAASSSSNGSRNKDVPDQGEDLWDPFYAARHNVHLRRSGHDSWGIKKIVLLFCDDFLRRVYEMPWWHGRSDIREAVQPVLDVVFGQEEGNDGLPKQSRQHRRIVRMLLTSLPPGVSIPIHHDTGLWVEYTHRVHVPILVNNPEKILFRCGPSPDLMQRIPIVPGHVFEINNQAKHAVSNCDSDYRVHLIIDYVDEDLIARRNGGALSMPHRLLEEQIALKPGEALWQTRRSVDRECDAGKRPTPTFFILGAQKAGTTSFYEYMAQHPLIVRPRQRETHCLDWRWVEANDTNHDDRVKKQRASCHRYYQTEDLRRHPSCLTGDSTPSYLLDSRRVIPRMQQVFDHDKKFFVLVRNPVRRAESHYAMVTSSVGTPKQLQTRGSEYRGKTFAQIALEDLQKMKECGLIPYWDIDEGRLDKELFASFSGSDQENEAWDRYLADIPLGTGSHSLLSRGLYELNLRPWFQAFDQSDFVIFQLERDLRPDALSKTMARVWDHLDLSHVPVVDETPRNTRDYDPIVDADMKAYLERFYRPHNERLAALLSRDGDEDDPWKDLWPCDPVDDNGKRKCPFLDAVSPPVQ